MGQLISLDQYKNYKVKTQQRDEMDHQNQTFISMLRSFLREKEPVYKIIHIEIMNRSQFKVLDSFMQPIISQKLQMDNEDTLFEDKLLSAMMEHTSKKYYIDKSDLLDVGVKHKLREVFGNTVVFI